MGASSSKGGRPAGASAIDEKLSHLRSHVADTMVTHGLIQEITVIINKNANGERDRFCQLLLAASGGSAESLRGSVVGLGESSGTDQLGPTASSTALATSQAPPLSLSTAADSAGTGSSGGVAFHPFAELFAKVRLMTDAASRTSVVHWLRHVSDANEEEWTSILVRNNIVSFVSDFYQFQANTHVPPETLTNMSHLLARWSAASDAFAVAMNGADAFRGVMVRLKFAQTSSKERSYLLSAMRRCYRSGLSRNDAFDILTKICLERDENVEQTHVDCLEMIADALMQRNDLIANLTQKHITAFQRFFGSSNALVASAMRLCVTIVEVEERLGRVQQQQAPVAGSSDDTAPAPAAGAGDAGSPRPSPQQPTAAAPAPPPATKSYTQELIKVLCGVFDIALIDNPFAVPLYLVATCNIAIRELGSDTAVRFVELKHLSMLVRKVYRATMDDGKELALRFANLVMLLLDANPSLLAAKIAAANALHLLLDAITVVTDETSMEAVVQAASELCLADPNVGAALCADRKLHMLMQTTHTKKTPEETLVVVWGLVRLLESILTPQVLSTADEMLVMTVYSLLCQIMGSCTVPPRRFFLTRTSSMVATAPAANPAPPAGTLTRAPSSLVGGRSVTAVAAGPQPTVTEKILKSSLQMLIQRCSLGSSYAESILGQVPLGTVRALISAEHLPVLSELAKALAEVMAKASVAAMSELSILGCLVDRLDPERQTRNATVSLKRFQRHWKRVLQVRKISDNRVRMANLLKETFMCRLNVAHDETLSFQSIVDEWMGNLARIHQDYEERDQLIEQHERQTEALRRTEAHGRLMILMQMSEDAEQRFRFKVRVEEQQIRVNVAPQRQLAGKECHGRVEIATESFGTLDTMLRIHKAKFQELQLRLVKRNALLDAEVLSRNGTLQSYQAEHNKLVVYQVAMHLSEDERKARHGLTTKLLSQHVDFLKESFVILLRQTQEDQEHFRTDVVVSRDREFRWLNMFHEQTEVMQVESFSRLEWIRVERITYSSLVTGFLSLLKRQLEFDESRERSKAARSATLDWRVCALPYERLTILAHEDIKRKQVANDHRIGLSMLAEASRYMKPIVCQAEELRLRQEIDLEYVKFSHDKKWVLAYFRLVREELAARNAVALQYFYIARNLLVPLMCIRLVDYQHRLLLADLSFRTDIWLEERDQFYLLLLAEVRDMQKLFRAVIATDQAQDHERLAQHFVTVTHVVRLQEQAQNALTDYAVQQRALLLHSGFKKPTVKKENFVSRVKAMSATF